MKKAHYSDDGVNYRYYSHKIGDMLLYIDLLEYTVSKKEDRPAKFLAAYHRGYPTSFDHSLFGQASTKEEAIAIAQRKLCGLSAEQIQATPPGNWIPAHPRQPYE